MQARMASRSGIARALHSIHAQHNATCSSRLSYALLMLGVYYHSRALVKYLRVRCLVTAVHSGLLSIS
jgi:hypothetical protein